MDKKERYTRKEYLDMWEGKKFPPSPAIIMLRLRENKITQKQLAEKLSITPRTLSKWLMYNGIPLERMQAMHQGIKDILTDRENKNNGGDTGGE